jgi:hypothetical protein
MHRVTPFAREMSSFGKRHISQPPAKTVSGFQNGADENCLLLAPTPDALMADRQVKTKTAQPFGHAVYRNRAWANQVAMCCTASLQSVT